MVKPVPHRFYFLLRANVPIASQLLGLFFETVLAIPSTRATIIKYVLSNAGQNNKLISCRTTRPLDIRPPPPTELSGPLIFFVFFFRGNK